MKCSHCEMALLGGSITTWIWELEILQELDSIWHLQRNMVLDVDVGVTSSIHVVGRGYPLIQG